MIFRYDARAWDNIPRAKVLAAMSAEGIPCTGGYSWPLYGNPLFTQTDFNFSHAFKVNKDNEHQVLEFQGTFTNLFNQHAVVGYWQGFDTNNTPYISSLFPFSVFNGASFYQQVETGYDVQNAINSNPFGFIKNTQYGQPNRWQRSREIRLGVRFTF